MVATASGQQLGKGRDLRLRAKDLAAALSEYQKLPEAERRPKLPDPKDAVPAKRKVPAPPPGGLIVRGYCTYLRENKEGKIVRAKEYYYMENPDRWPAETQSDLLWLTKSEWQSLVPPAAKEGDRADVAAAVQTRFFTTIGIDYMEGSVSSVPQRKTQMTLTVERVMPKSVALRLDGYAHLGKEFDDVATAKLNKRGCEVRVLGYLTCNTEKQTIMRFDVVGIGKAWGVAQHTNREVRIADYPWTYGIACELVQGDSPMDLIAPYNLLHYGAAGPYLPGK